jgi:hypothetical protein
MGNIKDRDIGEIPAEMDQGSNPDRSAEPVDTKKHNPPQKPVNGLKKIYLVG